MDPGLETIAAYVAGFILLFVVVGGSLYICERLDESATHRRMMRRIKRNNKRRALARRARP